MAKPIEDVREVSRIAYGFMASKALFSALHLDVFSRLEERPQTAAELAADTGIAGPRMQTLLSALAGIGLIVATDDRWTNAPASARYLVTGSRLGFGEYYKSQIDEQIYPLMMHLMDGLRGNVEHLAGVLQGSQMADAEEADQFSRAQHAGSLGPAHMLARRVDLSGASQLLDVAGGSGAFTITLCARFPDLRATIVDFPNVVTVARRYVAEAGLSDRVEFLAGNALDVDWPDADVVLMSYLLSAVRGSDIRVLVERARDALNPAGQLLVHDFMLEDDRQGPDLAALWFLQYLAVSTDTVSFTQADITARITEVGLVDIVGAPLIPGITRLVSAVQRSG
jgi:ubiquinone/menaquinone biosynthesis C-methylase UbiE